MRLGIVTATVTSTVNHPIYDNRRLLIVAICDASWEPTGAETLAVDTVQAGIGDRVLVLKEGNSARAILGAENPPMQEMIVGIVDAVSLATAAPTKRSARPGRHGSRRKRSKPVVAKQRRGD